MVGEGLLLEAVGTGIGFGPGYLFWGICMVMLCGPLGARSTSSGGGARPLSPSPPSNGLVDDLPSLRAALSVGHGALVPWQHLLPVMGAKIGKGAQLNTDNIKMLGKVNPRGRGGVMGGHATINATSPRRVSLSYLPSGSVTGLARTGSIVQPGCEIGAGAVVASRAGFAEMDQNTPWGGLGRDTG
ncbi:MAG: hypothetical protein Ct9H300mP10_06170 [Methanobacteriota archaeon]|nr:MAG: hypothetical protein Ct9H300mP10_06170 [Euryarchaeota archaeon]